jgi:hypothetical protein
MWNTVRLAKITENAILRPHGGLHRVIRGFGRNPAFPRSRGRGLVRSVGFGSVRLS